MTGHRRTDDGLPPALRAVAERVRAAPDAPAVSAPGDAVTYQELWDRSSRVAQRVVHLGAGSGGRVGLHLERSSDLIAAILGVMRAGGVAVPLDVSYPRDRLRFMCDDAGVELVIGHAEPLDRLGYRRAVAGDGSMIFAALSGESPPPAGAPGDDLAYIVYTSGSTGRPKGVLYEHHNLANLIAWQIATSGCGHGDRTLQFSPASFDVIFQETLTTLGEGGTLVCCTEDERLDPQALWDLIARERVNRLFLPFVMLQSLALFAQDASPGAHPLLEILTTGEQMQIGDQIRALFDRLPGCRLVNQWGTTETHVATWHPLLADVSSWPALPPIGTPISGTRVHVCDEDGHPVPDGEVGELWIAGDCVGPGYLNLPDLTARAYVPDPVDPAVRAYRTGDLGRVGADGRLECLGREDTQVKVRGFRVELGEIEALIKSMPAVAEAVVTVAGHGAEGRRLLAYVVARPGQFDPAEAAALLRGRLPEHMVPAGIELVPSLPRTPSGKLDRRAVSALATSTYSHRS
ncbi:amino acid adenylation domain-containing protein [Nonomuraea lactucae]|uniref:amino acid adenylation domain-containing protein n=1 Tax=Nonomuraea lactucae TaxID=2249762 RepID=UPI0013B3E3D5|nr:amino acid adenylation domain-containing protein [Nonomuraea lactucae]